MRRGNRRGDALIEFTLLGIPLVFATISVVEVGIDMWEFHNLAFVAGVTSRYISMHGATCAQNGNSCTITVGTIATFFIAEGKALNSGSAIMALTDGSGTTTCNPVSSCTSSATKFPNASYNSVGSNITVKATYTLTNPFFMYWAPETVAAHDFTVAASSQARIVF
ncbi:MAG: hypothetical protein ABSB15_20070 [Bryobacteraceae bacterium]|jgi:Flp pilus assembly protein TadG